MSETTFTVPDTTCGHCEKTIRAALNDAVPDAKVTIDLSSHEVTIDGDADKAMAAMQEVGYMPERAG